jgi:PAS domain-containing protein
MQGTNDMEQVMKDVLDTLLSVFDCDRAWLVYPCDPDAQTWQTPMERTRPEFPGVLPIGVELPLDTVGAKVYRILRDTDGPVKFGIGEEHPVPAEIATSFKVLSFIAMAFYPKIGKPWSFGLHQCSYARAWSPGEERLFKEIGRRLSDTVTSLLAFRNLQESEEKYRTLIQKIQAAVVVHGADTQILTSNSMAQELLGFTEDQMLGKTSMDPTWHFLFEDGTAMPSEEYPVNVVLGSRKPLRNFIGFSQC